MSNIFYDIETLGLESMSNRIVSIAVIDDEGEHVFLDQDESVVLRQFFSRVSKNDDLIGFNNIDFDFPYLIKRSLINLSQVETEVNHIDLRRVANSFLMNYNRFAKGKLTDWATIMNMPVETHSGSDVPNLWKEGKFEEIKKHNLEDVRITKALFQRCQQIKLLV